MLKQMFTGGRLLALIVGAELLDGIVTEVMHRKA